jgi:indolepyruvate ferredoxin oxidoreductase alpha subunit
MIPAHARKRHLVVEERLEKLRHFAEETPYNRVESNGSDIGVITGGVSYQYCKEVAPDFDYFKIGMGYPLPFKKIAQFVKAHKRVIVVEELEPFYEDMIRAHGLMVEGKKFTGTLGERRPK